MNTDIKDIIKRIYFEKDYDFFRERCLTSKISPSKLTAIGCSYSQNTTIFAPDNCPAVQIEFDMFLDKVSDFSIHFSTILKLSKIADIYAIIHTFSVPNSDGRCIEPTLDGFGGQPYIVDQMNLETKIKEFLFKMGFQAITLAEMEEVIGGIECPQSKIFGPQFTVECALFRDLVGILDNP